MSAPARVAGRGRPVAAFVTGPPGSGKTTLAAALAGALRAALLDLDVATGPLTTLVLGLIGAHDLSEPAAARFTRDARYETLLGLAEDTLRAGTSAVIVAPLTAERSAAAWSQLTARLDPLADVRLLWLAVERHELAARLAARNAPRDAGKLVDLPAYLAGVDLSPPDAPHLALDAHRPLGDLLSAALAFCT